MASPAVERLRKNLRDIADKTRKLGVDEGSVELLEEAFLLFFAAGDTDKCIDYLETKLGSGTLINKRSALANVKSNQARVKYLDRIIYEEKAAAEAAGSGYDTFYLRAYEAERDILECLLLGNVIDLASDNLDAKVEVEVTIKSADIAVEDEEAREAQRKKDAKAAAKLATVGKDKLPSYKDMTDEQADKYDAAFNAKYKELGGEDEKALNPMKTKRNKEQKKEKGKE